MIRKVDRTALKTNQAFIVGLLVIAFILNSVLLVALVALAMIVGVVRTEAGPFRLAYNRVLRPSGLLHPRVEDDDPAPHRFAMGMGAGVLVLAVIAFLAGAATVGWVLSWIVVALAAVNLTVNFCMGCFVHYQLTRHGLIGSGHRRGLA